MQRIERYGVIALVFLLVTIVAVSLWGEQRKSGGLFHFLKRESKNAQVDRLVADAGAQRLPPSREATTRDAFGRALPTSGAPVDEPPLPHAQRRPEPPYVPEPLPQGGSFVPPADVPDVIDLPHTRPAEPLVHEPPPPAAEPKPAPAPAGPRKHTVRAGETLSGIAQSELGSVKRMGEIVALNQGLEPDLVYEGQVLLLPPLEGSAPRTEVAQAQAAPIVPPVKDPAPSPAATQATRRYTVRAGDSLSKIAMEELGTIHRQDEILRLNPKIRPDHVMAGQVLLLPAGEPAPRESRVAAADRPATTPRRSKVQ